MTPDQIGEVTRKANLIGKPGGLTCKYEYDGIKKMFKWVFFRHGRRVGSTTRPGAVVGNMTKLVTVK